MVNTEKRSKAVWVILLLVLLTASWVPVNYIHRSLFPTDDPKYIRRVYAEHTVGQAFHTKYETNSIRIIVRGSHPSTQTLHAALGEQSTSTSVHLTEEDQWVALKLESPLPIGEHELTLSAPEITSQADAVLVRFQVDSTNFEPGYMIVDGEASYGDIAFHLVDRIPAWVHIPRYFHHHPNHSLHVFRVAALAAILGFVTTLLPASQRAWRYALFALIVFAIAIRIPTLAQIDGVFGGDAFNYLSKGKAWISGDDPFNAEPRKGPFLPFILIPTLLTRDPILWSRFIGAIFAGIAAAATATTLNRLNVVTPLALLGGLLVAVNREFWWESLNGLANVPYAALIALSTLSLVENAPFATGLFAALTTLTRYEGILVAAIYVPALWIKNRFSTTTLRRSLVPLLILLAIPFVFWPISGALGVRTAGDILSDSGLYIAWDWHDYVSNLQRAKHFLEQLWFFRYLSPMTYATHLIYAATLVGAVSLLKRRPLIGVALMAVVLSQIAVVTAILPKTRYYVQVIPLLALWCIYAVSLLPRRTSIVVGSIVVASVWVNSWLHLPKFIEDYNYRARGDSILMQASVFLKKIESRPAFATNFFSVETVFPLKQVVMGAPEDTEEQLAWLRTKRATHLVETTEHPWFEELLKKYPEHFHRVTSFKASYDPAQATIYEVQGL